MSIKRRCLELKRFIRHRSILLCIFGIFMFFFIFTVAYLQDQPQEAANLRVDRKEGKLTKQKLPKNRVGRVDRHNIENELRERERLKNPAGAEKGELDDNDVENMEDGDDEPIAGEADPWTVFTEGVPGNYEPTEPQKRYGEHGEMGEPVRVDGNLPAVRASKQAYGFNTYVSDMISLNRSIPDVRMPECKYWNYPENLPTASVIIAFHNEGWSPLLRTVHSVILRSPAKLLKEIILVDDYSDKAHLKEKLDGYVKKFSGLVKLIRNTEREGLIRTRSKGAVAATGDVVIFLDAHCEVNINWLPPLLAPIKHNRKVMTVPVIDGIDMDTWEYRRVYGAADRHFRGIFEWGLLYKETEISPEERRRRKHDSEPFRSPTHAGGLFAIDKSWFEELGYYDPGLQIWGGEQYELSFKIWQCGGGILFVPCAHVGHVYRSHMPYGFGKLSGKPVIATNLIRVVKIWMDEYGEYYFIREPQNRDVDPGNITSQLELKKKLHCKSFKWYMEKVAYDVLISYPFLPENHVWGEARNPHTGKCIDAGNNAGVGVSSCHGYGGNQMIKLNKKGQMTQGEWCISYLGSDFRSGLCRKGTVDGPFSYDEESSQIKMKIFGGVKCLTATKESNKLLVEPCDASNEGQKWVWREIYI